MSAFEAVLLGLVQGLTEFLPVSSSGHLVMSQEVLGIDSPGVFLEVALHLATLLSVVLVYRRTLLRLLVGTLQGNREAVGYVGLLLVASVPAGVVGLGFEDAIEATFDTPAVTGFMLIVTGFLLWSTRRVARRPDQEVMVPGWKLALGIGAAQAFAILPGISRSGSTITAGLWARMNGAAAAEFSFLMSIPAIAGAVVLQLPETSGSVALLGLGALIAGFLAALISGIAAIIALVWLLRRQEFYKFAFYLWPVGSAFLLYLWLR
ncbi:MAG: undecaprenyl-diphosphate phosphatase [Longimicrobiales bacterium]